MMETGSITAQPDALRTAADQLAGCADTVSRLRDGYEANPPGFAKCSPHIPLFSALSSRWDRTMTASDTNSDGSTNRCYRSHRARGRWPMPSIILTPWLPCV